jgi:hypothetical protein
VGEFDVAKMGGDGEGGYGGLDCRSNIFVLQLESDAGVSGSS